VRDGERVSVTYATTGRGVEALGSVWAFLLRRRPVPRVDRAGGSL
jgi:hypothetical protein